MRLRRFGFALSLAAFLVAGCGKKKQTSAGPVALTTQSFQDTTGHVQIDLGYQAKGPREIELVVNMKAIGLDEMDKIVIDFKLDGFVLIGGVTEWSGFVPPRQNQRHTVLIQAGEGVGLATATLTVRRSADSELLLETPLEFQINGDVVSPQ